MVVVCACDSDADWTPIDCAISVDTADFKEGTGSLKFVGLGAVPNVPEAEYDPTGTWDWETFDPTNKGHIVFWFKTSERSDLKFRVWSGANAGVDFIEWGRQFLQQVPAVDTWYRVKLYKDDFDAKGGTINWAAVKALRSQLSQTIEFITFRIDDIRVETADPIKAKIGAAANLDYVSDDVLEADIWGDDLKVGRWQLLLKNVGNKYGGRFHSNEASDIEINAVTMMKGYVDDVFPFLDDRGYYTNKLKIMGRDYGRDLARLMYSGKYVDEKADDLMDAILAAKGSEITFESGHTANLVTIERSRTYLIDWLQSVAGRTNINYSAYVDQAKALKFFAVGTESSGVALKSVALAVDNNILHLLKGEEIGFSIANDVELSAGSLHDHYSDANPNDFSVGAGVYPPEACSVAGYYKAGTSSIKFGCLASNTLITIYLDFLGTLYNYSSFDLSDPQECYFIIKPVCAEVGSTWVNVRPWLEDGAGCRIEFKRPGKIPFLSAKGKTEDLSEGVGDENWHKVVFTVGDTDVKAVRRDNKWGKIAGALPFDWTDVVKIGVNVICPPAWGAVDLYLDALTIPNIEVISQIADATSDDDYGTSEWFEQRNDIKSQVELDAAALTELEKRKDPLKNIIVIATGQTGIKYPGLTVTVQAPKHGLAGATTYRIVSYHHQYRKEPIKGAHCFITTLDLVKEDLSPATQFIDPRRYMLHGDPVGAALETLALTRRRVRTSQTTQRKDFGDTQPVKKLFFSSSGIAFPTDPDDGYIFRLTTDIVGYLAAVYEYDEGAADWFREPMVMHLGADPPAGTEVLYDTLHRTDQDKWYRWDGAAWQLISFAATTISGTLSSTQLKKGIQKFDSSVLVEAIRVIATSAVTFDVDVNDGTGKAEITASAGTPFSDFTAGDELVIQSAENPLHNTTARTVNAVNGGGSSITLDNVLADADNPSDEMMIVSVADGLKWTGANPAIWFSDGTTQNIANGTIQGLAPATYWVIFTVSGAVSLTSTYANAVGDTVGIIARVTIVAGREPFIFPVFTRGGSQTLDFLGAGVIDTILLTGDALIGKILKTSDGVQWAAGGDPGVIITRDGIRGKGAAGALMVEMLATTGKLLAAGGDVILDDNGINIYDQALWFLRGATTLGYMYGYQDLGLVDWVVLATMNAAHLLLSSDNNIYLGPGGHSILPVDPLDKIGSAALPFDEMHAGDHFGTFRDLSQMYAGDETVKTVVGAVETEIKTLRIIKDTSKGLNISKLRFVGEAKVDAGTGYLKVSIDGGASTIVWTFTDVAYAHQEGEISVGGWGDNTVHDISIRLDNSGGGNTTDNRTIEVYVLCDD